jgi:hypothetical protein
MSIAVVSGATLQCTCGSACSQLRVTSQLMCAGTPLELTIDNRLVATVEDRLGLTNVGAFGICSAQTAANAGTPTPCVPAPTGAWKPGSCSVVRIGTQPALLNTDKLSCTFGGVISIVDPGQQRTSGT